MEYKGKITPESKAEVLSFVELQTNKGRTITEVLDNLNVPRSSYYKWKNDVKTRPIKEEDLPKYPNRVTPEEIEMVLKAKELNPDMRHRQIQGVIQQGGHYISPTSVYKIFKEHGLVETYQRRPAPWKVPRYEVYRRNLVWGEDWTKIKINYQTWHLFIVIDFFSRYIVNYRIVPEVNSEVVKDVFSESLEIEEINENEIPHLRADRGSPNTSRITKDFFDDMGAVLSFARVRRPTDNAITERFFGTIKQEEIYMVGNYPDLINAEDEVANYIDKYNWERPHQSL